MIYKAKNIDTEKAERHLRDLLMDSQTRQAREREKIEKYYEGYREGIENAISIFYCSNYEKKESEKKQ